MIHLESWDHAVRKLCPMASDNDEDVMRLEEEGISLDRNESRAMNTVVTEAEVLPITFLTYDDVKAKAMDMVRDLCAIVGTETHIAEDLLQSHRWDMAAAVLHITSHRNSAEMKSDLQEDKPMKQEVVEEVVPMVKRAKKEHHPVESSGAEDIGPAEISLPKDDPAKSADTDQTLEVTITDSEVAKRDDMDKAMVSTVEKPEDVNVAMGTAETDDATVPMQIAHSEDEITPANIAEPTDEEVTMTQDKACRPPKTPWPRITGNFACAMCFEERNGYSTDCDIVVCEQCWKGYFVAEFSGGVNGLIRCPFSNCNSIVPLWLMEECYEKHDETAVIILACYRSEFFSDFVLHSEYFQFCPSPTCHRVIQAHPGWSGKDVVCQCGYAFCFVCLNEAHFPAECIHAKEIASLLTRREMQRIGVAFGGIKRCSNCEGLVENVGVINEEGDFVKCSSCEEDLNWSSLLSCRESLEKACYSRFPKRSAEVELQIADLVMECDNWRANVTESDRLICFPDICIDADTWQLFVRQTEGAIRLLKWTKLFCLLGVYEEQVERQICDKADRIYPYLHTFLNHLQNGDCTREILLSIQDMLRMGCQQLEKCLEGETLGKDKIIFC